MRSSAPYSSNPEHDKLTKLKWDSVSRLLKLAIPYRGILALAGVLVLFSTAVNLSLPLFARTALDRVLSQRSLDALDRLALAIIGLILLSAVFSFTQAVLIANTGNRIVTNMRSRLFAHLQRLPVAFFDRSRSGDLASHLSNDVSLIQQTLTSDLVNLAGNLITLIGGIAVAIYLDWELCLVVVGLLMLVMLFFVISGRRLRKLTRQGLDALSEAMGAMTEALANIRLVKAFAREKHEDHRAEEKLEVVYRINVKASIREAAMGTVGFVGFISLMLGVVWYGGRSVMSGHSTPGSLLAFFMTVTIISGPMGALASLYTRLQRAVGAADRLFDLFDETAETPDPDDAIDFPAGPGQVELRRIEFGYVPDTPVLAGLNLTIPAGKVTALVGHSGGGKTTVASLLFRFYEPQQGEILIDGVPLRTIRRAQLREHVGIVPQDPQLFNGSILDNIRYGRLNAPDSEVVDAAKAANVDEFVRGFTDGYETMIGERGVTLSGGQRQRVAIARAVLKDPRILVLDEATSALDTRSEALVREALERLMRGRTTLVIAHRLSTVQDAYQIAVLDDGRIVELGTHEELLTRRGRYASLLNLDSDESSPVS